MRNTNINKIKPFFKLVIIYIVYILITSGVLKFYTLNDAMDPLNDFPITIGTIAFLVESVYLGFYFGGKKHRSFGEYIGLGMLFIIIGAIVQFVSDRVWYILSQLAERFVFNIIHPLKGYTIDRAYMTMFIFAQFNLIALYRFLNKRKNTIHKDNSQNGNEDDQI